MLRLGIVVNPVAGIGGPAAQKGSDGVAAQAAATALGITPHSGDRMCAALRVLTPRASGIEILTWGGAMGAMPLAGLPFTVRVLGEPAVPSTSADTRRAAKVLLDAGIDLLLFAGGDGTARDVFDAVGVRIPVLGVPAGVKMHSGVFALTPPDAGEVVLRLLEGRLVSIEECEVRDIDEEALRQGRVSARHYGYLRTPRAGEYVQHVKSGGREDESLVKIDIGQYVAEQVIEWPGHVALGPGSTVAAVKTALGIDGTLLGFDVVRGRRLVARDTTAVDLEQLLDAASVVVLSFIAGQGALIGRGNQQLTPAVLRRVSRDRIWIVASRTKLASLAGRPLWVDTGEPELDRSFAGTWEIIAGYDDRLLYRIGRPSDPTLDGSLNGSAP